MECNSPEATRRKAYETLCSHSLYALARMGDLTPNKGAAHDDLHLSCASASPRAIMKRRSEDLGHVANTCSKKARLASICTPLADVGVTQMTPESDQALNQGATHDSIEMLSEYGLRVQRVINALVVGMCSS